MEVLISKGDLSEAQLCRTKIISKESPHISDQCKFLSTRLNLALAGKTWLDMTPAQTALINQIYLNNPETAINARAVLALTKGLEYERYPYDLQQNHSMNQHTSPEKPIEEEQSTFKIYPNPATDFTTVEITIDVENISAQLIIYDLLGTEIQRQRIYDQNVLTINTGNLSNGIYLFVVKTHEGILQKQKFIISR